MVRPGVEHVVAEHHVATHDFASNRPRRDHRAHVRRGKIVAVELNIEHPGLNGVLLDSGDKLRQPFRQWNSAALDADQHQALAAVALLHNFVGQPYQGALNLRRGHQPALDAQGWFRLRFAHRCSLAVSLEACLLVG